MFLLNVLTDIFKFKFLYEKKDATVKKVVLITGASTGLGLALAKKILNCEQFIVVLTSRKSSQFRFAAEGIFESPRVWIRDLDVIDSKAIETLINEINHKLNGVDILINNAGISDRATVEESGTSYRQRQLDVNYLAPFMLIGNVLSGMRRKRSGRIINVSSVGGFMAMPTMSAYSASKFALEGATESLWYEMKPWGIHVTLVIPGFINSEGFLHTTESPKCANSIKNISGTYHEHYVAMKSLIFHRMHLSSDTNEDIASKILDTMQRKNPPLRVYVTTDAWILFLIRKVCPPQVYFWVFYKILPNIKNWGKQKYIT